MLVGVGAAALATTIGVVVGSVAGYREGVVDAVLMRATELFMIVPQFFLAVVLVVLFGASNVTMILVIGLLGWPVVARVVRAEVMTLKSRVYVAAARSMGVGPLGIVVQEILPNCVRKIAVVASAQVAQAILLEASLGYLGVGDPNQVSLGLMLQEAQLFLRDAYWMAIFPAAALFLMILCSNVVADEMTASGRVRGRRRGAWMRQLGLRREVVRG
jgi:peptide/nickel transport system permease protein